MLAEVISVAGFLPIFSLLDLIWGNAASRSEVSAINISPLEVRTPEDGKPTVGLIEDSTRGISPLQKGMPEVSTAEDGIDEVDIDEVSISEISMEEDGTFEVRTTKVGTFEVGTFRVSTIEESIIGWDAIRGRLPKPLKSNVSPAEDCTAQITAA